MSDLLFDIQEGIGRITINRPEKRNALNDTVLKGICGAIDQANKDPEIRLITITGAGEKAFSSGGDLQGVQGFDKFGPTGSYFARSMYSDTLKKLSNCMVPIIGIANGDVLAGAMGIFLSCDITVAIESARFGLPEVNVGMFPMMVMSVLFKNIGRKKGMELVLLGEKFSAQDAFAYGILNRVFSKETFHEDVNTFIAQFSNKPGIVTRLGKSAFNAIHSIDPKAIELLQLNLETVMQTEDFSEGITAFFEKRAPHWKHR